MTAPDDSPFLLSGIITLTTDFGASSSYVAAVKGVILSINPRAVLVDVTHSIPPQGIRQGAWALAETCEHFPSGTVHLAIVDPGVGTDRRIVYAQIGPQHYVAPDNGLLSRLALRTPPSRIVTLAEPKFWLPQVSHTFHGRDIMAPVAARLSLGLTPDALGPRQDRLVQLEWPEVSILPGKIQGAVRSIDSFGNLVTDISDEILATVPRDERACIECDEHVTQGIFRTYADQPEMTYLALVGSSGYLELAIVGENAAAMLGVRVGTPVTITW